MDFRKIPKLNPNRVNRCYCYSNCWCDMNSYNKPAPRTITKLSPKTITNPINKFIKIRNENGQLRPKCDRLQYSGLKSLSSSSCSYNSGSKTNTNQTRRSTPVSKISNVSNYKDDFIKTPPNKYSNDGTNSPFYAINHTGQREWYELSKEQFWRAQQECLTRNFLLSDYFNNPAIFLTSLQDDQIADLNKFRLNNAEDCFNVLSKYTLNKRLGMYKEEIPIEHVCEFIFKINGRGLLEPSTDKLEKLNSGRIRCRICGKATNITDSNGFLPIGNNSEQKVQKIVIQVNNVKSNQQFQQGKTKIQKCQGFRRRKINEQGNSLALIYQKRY